MDIVPPTDPDHNILFPPPQPANPHMRAAAVNIPTVPVIPPAVTLAPGTRVQPGSRGKVPGILTSGGWTGRGADSFGTPSPATARRWDEWGASAGIPTIRRPALDVDIADRALALAFLGAFLEWREKRLGVARDKALPVRTGRAPKWLTPFVLAPGEGDAPNVDFKFTDSEGRAHMIQLLGRGKHYVACGWHPDTQQPYSWAGLAPGSADVFDDPPAFLTVTQADLLDLQGFIEAWLQTQGFPRGWKRAGDVAPPVSGPRSRDELRANTVGDVTALMAALPNVRDPLTGRNEWVQMAQAIHGALPDDHASGRDAFVEWSLRWTDEKGDLLPQEDPPGREFDKCSPSYQLGWDFLVQKGRDAGLDFALLGVNPAGTDFKAVADEDEDFREAVEARARDVCLALGREADEARPRPLSAAEALDAALDGTGDLTKPAARPLLTFVDAGADEPVAAALGPREFLDPFGHYEKGNVVLVSGRGGTMKTALELSEALALTTGRPLLGWTPTLPSLRVLHINLDEPMAELRRRVRAIAIHHGVPYADFTGKLFLAGVDSAGPEFRFTRTDRGVVRVNMATVRWLESEIVRLGVDVAMVDPLGAVLGSVNDNDVVYALLREFAAIAARRKIVILFAVHHRKSASGSAGGEAADVDAVMGAASLTNAARLVRTLTRMSPEQAENMGIAPGDAWRFIKARVTKGNHVRAQEDHWFRILSVSLNNAQGPWPADEMAVLEPWTPPTGGATPTQQIAILTALDTGLPDGRRYSLANAAARDVSALALVMGETGLSRPVCQDLLKAWVDDGTIYEDTYERPRGTRGGGSGRQQRGVFVKEGAVLEILDADV